MGTITSPVSYGRPGDSIRVPVTDAQKHGHSPGENRSMSIETPSVTAALAAVAVEPVEKAHWAETVITVVATTIVVLIVSSVAVLMGLA